MFLLDIGANRGDAVAAGIKNGFDKIVAVEAAPKVFKELVKNYIYNNKVIPINFAVSDVDNDQVEFYECIEDGLSTLEKSWLTDPSMPYYGKEFRTIGVNTITIDKIVNIYGIPDLIKIDVEGAETKVLNGMTKKNKTLCFEWTINTLSDHIKQLEYLRSLGYKTFALQFIEHHLQIPKDWLPTSEIDYLPIWIEKRSKLWEEEEWKVSGLRNTADVGMLWVD